MLRMPVILLHSLLLFGEIREVLRINGFDIDMSRVENRLVDNNKRKIET